MVVNKRGKRAEGGTEYDDKGELGRKVYGLGVTILLCLYNSQQGIYLVVEEYLIAISSVSKNGSFGIHS